MGRLDVRIVEARNLPNTELIGKPDPYVKIELSDSANNHMHKTSTASSTTTPKWDEVFKFIVADPDSAQLTMKIYNKNMVSDDFMGQYRMSIAGLTKGVVKDSWILLQQCKTNAEIHIRLLAHDFGAEPAPGQTTSTSPPTQSAQPPVQQQTPPQQYQQTPPQQQQYQQTPPQMMQQPPMQQYQQPQMQQQQQYYQQQQHHHHHHHQPQMGAYPGQMGGYPGQQQQRPPQQYPTGYPTGQPHHHHHHHHHHPGYPQQQPGYPQQQQGGYPGAGYPGQPGYRY